MMKLALAFSLVAGCVTVGSSTAPDADLSRYHTFAWYDSPTKTRRQAELERSPAGEVVRARIARMLAQKGIFETTAPPDFFIDYHARLEKRLEIDDWGMSRLNLGPPGPVRVDERVQGAIIVDFIDPRTGEIFWRGAAVATVERPNAPNMRKLTSAVDSIMARYPAPTTNVARRMQKPQL